MKILQRVSAYIGSLFAFLPLLSLTAQAGTGNPVTGDDSMGTMKLMMILLGVSLVLIILVVAFSLTSKKRKGKKKR